MATALVDQADVEAALLRPLTTAEANYIGTICAQASAKLRIKLRAVDARIALSPTDPAYIDPDAVSAMLAGVIKRTVVNPRGLWSSSDGEGPYSHSETYRGSRGAGTGSNEVPGELAVTDDDVAQLFPTSSFTLPATIHTRQPPVRPLIFPGRSPKALQSAEDVHADGYGLWR